MYCNLSRLRPGPTRTPNKRWIKISALKRYVTSEIRTQVATQWPLYECDILLPCLLAKINTIWITKVCNWGEFSLNRKVLLMKSLPSTCKRLKLDYERWLVVNTIASDSGQASWFLLGIGNMSIKWLEYWPLTWSTDHYTNARFHFHVCSQKSMLYDTQRFAT